MKFSRPLIALALSLVCISAMGRPQLNEINFAEGKSATTIDGNIVRGEAKYYTLRAHKGQKLRASIAALEKNAAFQVYLPGYALTPDENTFIVTGRSLQGAGETDDAATWQGDLPNTGRYLIVVGATRGNAAYRLNIGVR